MKSSLPRMTKSQRRRTQVVTEIIGCIACYIDSGIFGTPADGHHQPNPKTGYRDSHDHLIPLCPEKHHKYGPVSVHQGKREFHRRYGSDTQLLAMTNALYEAHIANTIGGSQ